MYYISLVKVLQKAVCVLLVWQQMAEKLQLVDSNMARFFTDFGWACGILSISLSNEPDLKLMMNQQHITVVVVLGGCSIWKQTKYDSAK